MKFSPDAYLLHESSNTITFNIRIKVVMKDEVNGETLRIAAEKAFTRFPYYSKQIYIDQDGGIDLIKNPRTIKVIPVSKNKTYLFSKEVNYQPLSIEYQDNCIYFNMYHGMCGGAGTFLWIKTTIYEYICKQYEVCPNAGSTLMVDSPISEEEYAYPKLENIPNESPLTEIKKDEAWFPGLEYLEGFKILMSGDTTHHEFEIPKKELMKFISENDGSPMSAVSAIMTKALYRALPNNTLPIRIETNHNYRQKVGCPKTHHDLLSHVFFLIPHHAQNYPIDKLCTIIRGATAIQTQPEYGYQNIRKFYEYADKVDSVSGLNEKNKCAKENSHRVPDVHNSFLINYMGREDWGDMIEYIERVHVITDGHLLFEILDVGDKFCITFMQMNKSTTYMDNFIQILKEENIPYKLHGTYKNHLPISKVESAPIIK
jgi:hypothetical protein